MSEKRRIQQGYPEHPIEAWVGNELPNGIPPLPDNPMTEEDVKGVIFKDDPFTDPGDELVRVSGVPYPVPRGSLNEAYQMALDLESQHRAAPETDPPESTAEAPNGFSPAARESLVAAEAYAAQCVKDGCVNPVPHEVLGSYDDLQTWMSNVATDDQLDIPVPALNGKTGRMLLGSFGAVYGPGHRRSPLDDLQFKPPSPVEVAARFNEGKPSMHYVLHFKRGLEAVVKVCEYGETKYDYLNWKKGGKPDREYLDACMRHVFKHVSEGPYDEESKCLHLAHAIWNLLTLIDLNWYEGLTEDEHTT